MSRYKGCFLVIAATITFSTATLQAALEPLVRVTDLKGTCTVVKPDGTSLTAEEGVAYPYGSVLRTGADSSMNLMIASETFARLLPSSDLSLKGSMDSLIKALQLNSGSIEVTLGDGVGPGETLVTSTLPAVSVTGAKCTFRVAATQEGNMTVAVITAVNGNMSVSGPQYDVTMLPKGAQLSIVTPPDMQFIRIKDLEGDYEVTVTDSEGAPKNIKMKEGTVLKIWREAIPDSDMIAVTVLVTDANGVLKEKITSTQQQSEGMAAAPDVSMISANNNNGTEPSSESSSKPPKSEKQPKPERPRPDKRDRNRPRPEEKMLNRENYPITTSGTTTVAPTTPIGLW
jgi:hypothetical protein